VKYESLAGDPWNSGLRLRYSIADYRSGEELKIDDKVYLAPTRHISVGCDGGSCARI
jgi:hypothetical protein